MRGNVLLTRALFILAVSVFQAGGSVLGDTVRSVDISGCPGSVSMQQSGSIKEPILVQSGAVPAQARLESVEAGWALRCQAEAAAKPSAGTVERSGGTVAGVFINRAVGPGAKAVQNIGGKSANNSGEEHAAVKLQVPVGTRILAKAWTGSLEAELGVWMVNAELASGNMHFSRLHDSVVVVDSGSVTAAEATGRLSAHLRGAGSIDVANMRDAAVELQLTGAGSMTLKGRAASARVLATGAGHIEIEQVTSEPSIQLRGLATVDIGR